MAKPARAPETREAAGKHADLVEREVEDLGAGDDEATPAQMAEEFGDSESADTAKSQAEKADPDDEKNTP